MHEIKKKSRFFFASITIINNIVFFDCLLTATPPLQPEESTVKIKSVEDVSGCQTINNCNKIRKQIQQIASSKDSDSKKREDLTSLGSDDSGKHITT